MFDGDTIAAISTPAGSGGVGIVRVSGPKSLDILSALSGKKAQAFTDRSLVHGFVVEADEVVDEVFFVAMRGPRSFTGEDVAEIHGHGGSANMRRLLRMVVDAGARHAEAGEFTRRAFENGRIDLTRAEAIADIVNASSERALRQAQAQLRGALGSRVEEFREQVVGLLAQVEATIDFPETVSADESAGICSSSQLLAEKCEALVASFSLGRALRDGIDVALVGPVNSGKSSLFNALLEEERAVVTDHPGTTRDYLEATVVWRGVAIRLIDTAGERETADEVERRGIELCRQRVGDADLRVALVPPSDVAQAADAGELVVASKVDVGRAPPGMLGTSAVTREGLNELLDAILERTLPEAEAASGHVVTSERQRALLEEGARCLKRIVVGHSEELWAADLRAAEKCFGRILGEDTGDQVLDAVFSRFCIGK